MGAWGPGLYSGDFAMDLKSTVGAVARLPFDGDRLLDILIDSDPGPAKDEADEEHTVFWLVVADQFAKRGIACKPARDRALAMIDNGSDLAMAEKLGMRPADMAKRRRMLEELHGRLTAAPAAKSRTVLKKPQAFVAETGDLFVYPISGGRNINPYLGGREKNRDWRHDGWGAVVIAEHGHVLGFFAWYRPLTLAAAFPEKPNFEELRQASLWVMRRPGTCSAAHFKRLELERIGHLAVDPGKLPQAFDWLPSPKSAAISDISMSNVLRVGPELRPDMIAKAGEPRRRTAGRPNPAIASLDAILGE